MTVQKLETSVIIAGAGPAGAATSIFLSQVGIPHIVIEKETFPRDKVCGDACSGKTAFVLRKANPEWLEEIQATPEQFTPSFGITFVAPNGKPLDIPFMPNRAPDAKAMGFTVSRMVFDNFLFQKMKSQQSPECMVFQQAKINSISRTPDEKVIVHITHEGKEYEIASPILVGADGDKSMVKKTLHEFQSSPKAYSVGLRAYYTGVTDLHPENYIELHFLPEVLPGYLWIFPLPNGIANVGVGIASEVVRDKKINLREQMLKAIQTNPNISHRFTNASLQGKIQGWGLPVCIDEVPISGSNYLLTGDAASLIDPFSGEGIGNALYSGMLAAASIQQALQQKRFDAAFFKETYDDIVYSKLGDELKISATMQRLCKYPWLFNLIANKAYKSASLRNTISCMFTDLDMRDKLSKPSFYLNILFNR